MKGLLVTVNFNNWKQTSDLINSLSEIGEQDLTIAIADNSPQATETRFINEFMETHKIFYLSLGNNPGYFGGAKLVIDNLGAENYDYIIICNNDIVIENTDFFQLLKGSLHKYDVIAPSIRTNDGILQNPHRKGPISVFRKVYSKVFFLNYYIAKLLVSFIRFKNKATAKMVYPEQIEEEIYSPHGAFVIFAKTYFEKGAIIDDGYFLYGEEDSIVGQAKKNSLKIGYLPQLKILHLESISTGKGFSKSKYSFQKKAYRYISKTYGLFSLK